MIPSFFYSYPFFTMLVTRIVSRDQDSVTIYLDSGEKFVLNLKTIVDFGLTKEMEITDETFNSLKEESEKYLITLSALRILARRANSSFELQIKLGKKKYLKNPPTALDSTDKKELISQVIAELRSKGFVNDADFAERYSADMIANKKWGIKKIRGNLFLKGIEREIIEKVIGEIRSSGSDKGNIEYIARKKYNSLTKAGTDKKALRQKLFAFLFSRGYEYDDIREVLRKIVPDESSFEEE
ncbi:MAG: regulatory protein RecX [Ignavibacteriaceae bacterium]